MLRDRDSGDIHDKDEYFIFMKLGWSWSEDSKDNKHNGHETINFYKADEIKRSYTWFSTNALHTGMSKERVLKYNKLISLNKKVTLLRNPVKMREEIMTSPIKRMF